MRTLPIAFALGLALIGCGDDGIKTGSAPDLSASQDGAVGDLQVTDSAGIPCGTSAVCNTPKVCCEQVVAGAPQFMCVAPTACPVDGGGIVVACGGPQDCTKDAPYCCAGILFTGGDADGGAIMASSGGATCTATCPASFTLGTVSVAHTQLCHSNNDCSNYMGPISGTLTPFDGCCSTALAPGDHFCAPMQYAGIAPYTCP